MEYLDPDHYPNWKSQLRDGILCDSKICRSLLHELELGRGLETQSNLVWQKNLEKIGSPIE